MNQNLQLRLVSELQPDIGMRELYIMHKFQLFIDVGTADINCYSG